MPGTCIKTTVQLVGTEICVYWTVVRKVYMSDVGVHL